MAYCCSQCDFTAHFESALTMHHQLYHEAVGNSKEKSPVITKSLTIPRVSHLNREFSPSKENRGHKFLSRTSSATRLLGKLRARICKSKVLFSHPEEGVDVIQNLDNLSAQSECSARHLKELSLIECPRENQNETYGCHLCSFDADRITVLDRHLLNDHKIGLNVLLKLVMAKTKDGLSDNNTSNISGIRRTYYRPQDDIIEDGEFIIETVTPKVKILKHASVNTDLKWTDISRMEHCKNMEDIEEIIDVPMNGTENVNMLEKMETLNEYMSKFVDSSNTLKKVLTKEFSQKNLSRVSDKAHFELDLGDHDTPRNWDRAHSDKVEKNRCRLGDNRSDKKFLSESFYF